MIWFPKGEFSLSPKEVIPDQEAIIWYTVYWIQSTVYKRICYK